MSQKRKRHTCDGIRRTCICEENCHMHTHSTDQKLALLFCVETYISNETNRVAEETEDHQYISFTF